MIAYMFLDFFLNETESSIEDMALPVPKDSAKLVLLTGIELLHIL